jgi:hypothetical protein
VEVFQVSRWLTEPLYFGCHSVGHIGHYLFDRQMQHYRDRDWLSYLDGALQPEGNQVEGVARLHRWNGVTVLAFWDRSADKRSGSCSTFYLPWKLDFDQAVKAAREAFPQVWARFKFDVVPETETRVLQASGA